MKLSKALRAEILGNVLAATTFKTDKEDIEREMSALVRKLMDAKIPDEFKALTTGAPREWFQGTARVNVNSKHAIENAFNRERLDGRHMWDGTTQFECLVTPAIFDCNLTAQDYELILPIYQRAEKLAEAHWALEDEMTAFLRSCTTTERLLERMPELEPHIPKITRDYPIVASTENLLSQLLAAGFKVQPATHA
ncbi:Nmad5 family putative nucleotide modification protein [Herminiimonas sp. CN]|uniref:Nmad5 family putative nucleotide modification protein n=1 Tax=Herminiimonas sp. CN TaxID=1349818 RepID=UPI0004740F64|nr:Nmad5 family putative nucleotide modification protein [Herminiimonas sp. CN]